MESREAILAGAAQQSRRDPTTTQDGDRFD
jgi:hypothetical protein